MGNYRRHALFRRRKARAARYLAESAVVRENHRAVSVWRSARWVSRPYVFSVLVTDVTLSEAKGLAVGSVKRQRPRRDSSLRFARSE